MNNKTIIACGFRIIWRVMEISEGVICQGRNTLLDLHNSSFSISQFHLSLRADDNQTLISTVCEAAQRSLFWTPNGLNELPEVRFEFPFNLIGDHDKQNKGLF